MSKAQATAPHPLHIPHKNGAKRCSVCRNWLPLRSFSSNRSLWDGLRKECRLCHREQARKYREANAERLYRYHLEHKVKHRFGITRQEYDAIVAEGCAICGAASSNANQRALLHLDHDHSNGKLRAALCFQCNVGLGGFRDNPERMRVAATYIEEWRKTHG